MSPGRDGRHLGTTVALRHLDGGAMSTTDVRSDEAAGTASVTNVDMKVEVVVIPLPTSGGQRSSTSALVAA